MSYDYLRIYFNSGLHIDEYPLSNKIEIDCPNDFNGIGNITFNGTSNFYSGQWFKCDNFSTQFSNIEAIFAITLCNEDVAQLIWKKNFTGKSYNYWYKAATNIKLALNRARIKNNLDEISENTI